MRTTFAILASFTCAVFGSDALGAQQGAGAAPPIQGVWRVTEVVVSGGPEAGTYRNPQPNLYIFARQHYSIAAIGGTEPRPQWPAGSTRATLTEEQLRQTFEPYTSNSGTYTAQGNTLRITPSVALAPGYMSGASDSFLFEIRGSTLILTDTTVTAPVTSVRRTLTRVE